MFLRLSWGSMSGTAGRSRLTEPISGGTSGSGSARSRTLTRRRSGWRRTCARRSPHTLRHFLFTWLKTQGIDDALIQPYSGHATRQSLEIYSRLALADAQQRHDDVIGDFPV
jgi:integrase